jgi:hypothetical protein
MNCISKHLMQHLAVLMLAVTALSTAANGVTRKFALPRYLANPGGTVEVPLTLDNASGLAAIRIQINYDPEVLSFLSASAGPLGGAFELSRGKGDGFVQLLLIRPNSLAGGSGRLAVLKFRANAGAKAKTYSDLAIADIGLSDSSGVINLRQKDSLRLTNGRVAVTLNPNIDNNSTGPSEWWKDLQALSGLSLSIGQLNTAFSPTVFNYTSSVAETVKSIKVKPTLADPNASVRVNGVPVISGSPSAAIPLVVGINTLTIRVSSQNGNRIKTYNIKVTRKESSVATLATLVVNFATLVPKFGAMTTAYTSSVAASTASVRIKATASHSAAIIKINGTVVKSGVLSAAIPLIKGTTPIKVLVTAQNGSTKTYIISLARPLAAPVPEKSLDAARSPFLTAFLNPPPAEIMVSKVVIGGQTYLQLTTRRTPGTPKPLVEVSPNLMDWFSGDHYTTTLIDDGRVLKVQDKTPITSEAKRFIRSRAVAE